MKDHVKNHSHTCRDDGTCSDVPEVAHGSLNKAKSEIASTVMDISAESMIATEYDARIQQNGPDLMLQLLPALLPVKHLTGLVVIDLFIMYLIAAVARVMTQCDAISFAYGVVAYVNFLDRHSLKPPALEAPSNPSQDVAHL
jgi:hypothetical protein